MLDELTGHPLMALAFRRQAVPELMTTKKINRIQAWRMLGDAQDNEIAHCLNSAAREKGVTLPPEMATALAAARKSGGGFETIGDGTILQNIIAFFKAHPEIIKIALTLLMSLLAM